MAQRVELRPVLYNQYLKKVVRQGTFNVHASNDKENGTELLKAFCLTLKA